MVKGVRVGSNAKQKYLTGELGDVKSPKSTREKEPATKSSTSSDFSDPALASLIAKISLLDPRPICLKTSTTGNVA